jgi:gas vesicle protein
VLIADIGNATQFGALLSGLVGTVLAIFAFAASRSQEKRKASKDELSITWDMQQDLNKSLHDEIARLRIRVGDLEGQLDRMKGDYEDEVERLHQQLRERGTHG